MKYRVIITPEAENDLRTASGYLRRQGAPQAARAWLAGVRKKIKTLAENPERAHACICRLRKTTQSGCRPSPKVAPTG